MDYKVYVKDEATSKKVQEHAFKLGYSWVYNERNVKYANQPFLYFNYPDISFDTANVGFAEFKLAINRSDFRSIFSITYIGI
jgi:disulfide oxidoreductase YuzD